MRLIDIPLYRNEVNYIASSKIDWDVLTNKTILISGASGMIGSFIIDVLMSRNIYFDANIRVIALGRNIRNGKTRFKSYIDNKNFCFIQQDVNDVININEHADYIIHGASNTHPKQYSMDPIGTISTNIIGTKNMLDFGIKQNNCRTVFLSSVEIYGENRGDVDKFKEDYCGYIDCNTLRAGYTESKRAGEALCQAYKEKHGLNVVIPRLSRVYGPTMLQNDSKAISQFIQKSVEKENIILKSEGNQLYSYTYVADAALAIIYLLLYGKNGEAYNVADNASAITLKDLAKILANLGESEIIYRLPDENESKGYSKATKAVLDIEKITSLGWEAKYPIEIGLNRTVNILRSLDK